LALLPWFLHAGKGWGLVSCGLKVVFSRANIIYNETVQFSAGCGMPPGLAKP
jgi:hypothetical protein